MKIGVISDTHGDNIAWSKVKAIFKDCDHIIHAGDVLYHGPRNPIVEGYNPGELAKEINQLIIPIHIAKGNCDAEVDQMVINKPILSPYVYLDINNWSIIVNHGDKNCPNELAEIGANYGAKVVIYGHSHIFNIEKKEKVILLNPGSPSLPKETGIPTVAIIEDNLIKIIDINNGEIIKDLSLM